MTGLGTWWRTVRHLKLRQILGRARFALGASIPLPQSAPMLRNKSGHWIVPARRQSSLVGKSSFRFLNVEYSIDEVGWDPPDVAKLWRYNLHYFEDLNAFDAKARASWHVALMERWIRENPPTRGTAWEPFPCSLRIVNWIKWSLSNGPSGPLWLDSLALQARWLQRRVEWHLLGNHLFANAKALFMAGMFFNSAEADEWRMRAVSILVHELPEQVLEDGGQFERTPMYHRLALEDVLDLIAVIRAYGELDESVSRLHSQLRERAGRMLAWARVAQFADGSLPRFNDSANGVAPDADELERLAEGLGVAPAYGIQYPVHVCKASGYIRMQWDNALAFLDVAPVGPDYLPGHAHADTLSFELAVAGRLLVVNRGTSCYGVSPRRNYERGTAAHSTVELMGQNSSETWSGFRVGRRARPLNLSVGDGIVSCEHDGYRFLPGRPRHRRVWQLFDRGLVVLDEVDSRLPAVARYHLAPGLQAHQESGCHWSIHDGHAIVAELEIRAGAGRIVSTEHATGFGSLVPATSIEVDLSDGNAATVWVW